MPAGRPSIYNQKLADEICERISEGESLRSICNGPPNYDPLVDDDNHSHMPAVSTVLGWALNVDHEFHLQYEQARKNQAEGWGDKLIEVATHTPEVARARLITDNMKWIASRLLSSRYGDKVQTQITDADGEHLGAGAIGQLASLIASANAKKDAGDDDLA